MNQIEEIGEKQLQFWLQRWGGINPLMHVAFVPEHNINTMRDITLQPFSNKRLFGEHPLVLAIL